MTPRTQSSSRLNRRRFLAGVAAGAVGISLSNTPVAATAGRPPADLAADLLGSYGGTASTTVEYREQSADPRGYDMLGSKTYEKDLAGLLLEPPMTDPAHGSLDSAADESNPFSLKLGVGPGPVNSELHEAGDVALRSAHQAYWSPDPFEPPTLFQHWLLQLADGGDGSATLSGVHFGTPNSYNYVYTANPDLSTEETHQPLVPDSTLNGTVEGSTIAFSVRSPFFGVEDGTAVAESDQFGTDSSELQSRSQFACEVTVSR